jgi:uncharacterized protein (TIGR02284 family)
MKTTSEKNAAVFNDLIRINNDRTEGYRKAAKIIESKDNGLRDLFEDLANESSKNVEELEKYVQREGVKPAEGTTASGKIYRVWMDFKTTFSGNDRKSILEACEYGEDAAQKSYEAALDADAEFTAEEREVIEDQKMSLNESHNYIKSLRDRQRVSS